MKSLLASSLLALSWLMAAVPCAGATDTIDNGVVELTTEDDSVYGIKLVSVQHLSSGPSFAFEASDLWDVVLRDPTSGDWYHVKASGAETPQGAGTVAFTFSKTVTADAIQLKWTNVIVTPPGGPALSSDAFTLTLLFKANAGDDFISTTARIRRISSTPTLSVFRLETRVAAEPLAGAGSSQFLAAPFDHGAILRAPLTNPVLTSGSAAPYGGTPNDLGVKSAPAGGISMQWWAYYTTDPKHPADCLFYGTRDSQQYVKVYNVYIGPSQSYLAFSTQHYLENSLTPQTALDMTVPYPVVFTALEGDWYDAARYYREWALEQPWASGGPMQTSSRFSATVREADLFGAVALSKCDATPDCSPCTQPCIDATTPVCSGGVDYTCWQNWNAEMGEIAEYLGANSIVQKPFFWDFNSFSSCFGDWFPIVDEWHDVAATVGAQHPVAPYGNIIAYCQESCTFTGACSGYVPGFEAQPVSDFATRDADLSILTGTGCGQPRGDYPCGDPVGTACDVVSNLTRLCMGTDFVEAYALHLADVLTDEGARGLYLDVLHNENHLCFGAADPQVDDYHEHAIGGGNYWGQGETAAIQAVKEEMRVGKRVTDFFVMAEGPSENYLDEVEVVFHTTLAADNANSFRAPLYETVYNDHYLMGTTVAMSLDAGDLFDSQDFFEEVRQANAARIYMGVEVPGGSALSPLCEVSDCPTFNNYLEHPKYQDFADMLQRILAVTKNERARNLFRFGERLREPASSAALLDYSSSGTAGKIWPFDPLEPVVYTSIWGREGETVGVLLENWTDDQDTLPGSVLGGNKTVTVTVDLEADYGLAPGLYDLWIVTPTTEDGPYEFDYQGGAIAPAIPVPERSAVMWILE